MPVMADHDDKYGKRAQTVEELYPVAATAGQAQWFCVDARAGRCPGMRRVQIFHLRLIAGCLRSDNQIVGAGAHRDASADLRGPHALRSFDRPALWLLSTGMKRALDVVLAIVALPVAALLIFGCAIAIRLTSPGKAILRQQRVGRNERSFACLKLRTMYANTPQAPSHETSGAAVTPVGRHLRRLKLDELPQLINIIKGDMSFVGPRPCLPAQTALIEARRRYGLQAIRPGITGVAQVRGVDMSDPERLAALDATYLEDMSIGADLQLMLATALGAGRGDRIGT